MAIERYDEFLSQIPAGDFYGAKGTIIPFHDKPYSVRLTNEPNTIHDLYVNGVLVGEATTDSDGQVVVSVTLILGENTVELVNRSTGRRIATHITTRHWATWLAGVSDVMIGIDDSIGQIWSDRNLDTCSASSIEAVWGRRLRTSNLADYSLSTYQDVLRSMHQAYRQAGGKMAGIMRSVAAITQVNPLILPVGYGPEWVLGTNYIINDLIGGKYTAPITGTLDPAVTGAVITIDKFEHTLPYDSTLRVFFEPATRELSIWNNASSAYVANTGPLPTSGRYTATLPLAVYDSVWIGRYDRQLVGPTTLHIDIGNRGVLDIDVPNAGPNIGAVVAVIIQQYLDNDPRYLDLGISAVGSGGAIGLNIPSGLNAPVVVYADIDSPFADWSGIPQTRTTCGAHTFQPGAVGIVTCADASKFQPVTFDGQYKVAVRATINGVSDIYVCDVVSKSGNNVSIRNPDLTYQMVVSNDAAIAMAGELPLYKPNYYTAGEVAITIDDCAKLISFLTTVQGTVTAQTPDGWWCTHHADDAFNNGDISASYSTTPFDLFYRPNKSILDYRGMPVDYGIWLSRIDTYASPGAIVELGISFDGGSSWVTTTATPPQIGEPAILVSNRTIIPVDATDVLYRLRIDTASLTVLGITVRVDDPYIRVPAHTADLLGINTVARTDHRTTRANVCYVWNYEPLSDGEAKMLGLVSGVTGHLDTVVPAQVTIERFDVGQSVAGVFTDADISAGDATNMRLVQQSPARFSYLEPTLASEVRGEVLDISQGQTILLAHTCDGDLSNVFVYEDGVSLAQDQYAITPNGLNVALQFAPDPTKEYTIDYNVLMQYESAPINMPDNRPYYLWFTDYFDYRILDFIPHNNPVIVPVSFDTRGVATLSKHSDMNQATARLEMDDGKNTSVVSITDWQFTDANTISINPTLLNTSAIYTLTYTSRVILPAPRASVKLYVRTAAAPGALNVAQYKAVDINDRYEPDAWVQFKIVVTGVLDSGDIKVYSMCLKGLDLYGSGVPVLGGPY